MTERLSKTAQNELMNIVTIFLGVTVGATAKAETFLQPQTLKIIAMGVFCVRRRYGRRRSAGRPDVQALRRQDQSADRLCGRFRRADGRACSPRRLVRRRTRATSLLMHAMGPNVAGVIGRLGGRVCG